MIITINVETRGLELKMILSNKSIDIAIIVVMTTIAKNILIESIESGNLLIGLDISEQLVKNKNDATIKKKVNICLVFMLMSLVLCYSIC